LFHSPSPEIAARSFEQSLGNFLKRRIAWITQIGEHTSPIPARNESGVPVVSAASSNLRIAKS
jgi:hypothetical protein